MTDPAGIRWESLGAIVGAFALAVWALRDPGAVKQPQLPDAVMRFRIQSKNTPIRTAELADGSQLGRGGDCDLVLDDSTVSKHHARVHFEGQPWIEDLDSTNGTFVNGRRVTGTNALRRGDRIALGAAKLVFLGLAPRGTSGLKG
jgi:hypothetical protein